MNSSKVFKVISGLLLIVATTAYSQTAGQLNGAVIFLVACSIFLSGFFAGEDI
jgi:hypothetical protein